MWELIQRSSRQLRAVLVQDRDRARLHVHGLDMGAVMALAAGMGVSAEAVAEFVPDLEQVLVAKLNERAGHG